METPSFYFYYFTPYWLLTIIIFGVPALCVLIQKILGISKNLLYILLWVYCAFVIWYIVISRINFSLPINEIFHIGQKDVEFVPFRLIITSPYTDEIVREYIMNAILFEPVGILIGLIKWNKPFVKALVFACVLSFICEVLQFLTGVGRAEIDDLIFNTLGTLIGCIVVISLQGALLKHRK